ncbi:hypothetical protein L7F22_036119 [Adiantum nelumboides]|nr:hypothetical protein [Adiantum nelumboides]
MELQWGALDQPDLLEELLPDHDIICLTETHESPERGLLIVTGDEEASYIWIRTELSPGTWAYMAICYVSPRGSQYATQSEGQQPRDDSPYTRLSKDILRYSSLGEIFLMGDFNGRIQSRQCDTYDMEHPNIMRVVVPEEIRTHRHGRTWEALHAFHMEVARAPSTTSWAPSAAYLGSTLLAQGADP